MSCASCTEFEQSSAKPVWRQAITSEWSPKIDSACVASVRAVTCIANGAELARDLYMLGIIEQQALGRRKGRRQRTGLQRAVHGAGSAPFRLHFRDFGHGAPEVRGAFTRPLVAELGHRTARRDRINGNRLARAIRHRCGRPRCRRR